MSNIPSNIDGQRVRRYPDGSFGVPRRPGDASIQDLDARFARVGDFRWKYSLEGRKTYRELLPFFKGREVVLIGKGPSLDKITEADFDNPDATVICINESIHKVASLAITNPIFAMQQDSALHNKCTPARGALIVSSQAANHYDEFEPKYIYAPFHLTASPNTLTVCCAIRMALQLKAARFVLACFDSCVTRDCGYAEVIGYEPDRNRQSRFRFLSHRQLILADLKDTPHRWHLPGNLD